MRFVTKWRLCLVLVSASCLGVAACQDGGGDADANGSSFALTSCDTSDQCDAGFECAVFPCPADCADDANGRCDACQAGSICLPQPPAECDPALCGPGEVCQRTCSGACDLNLGQCTDVACQVVCLPVGADIVPDPAQACVSDFTDACLPPDYPVAARLDDVCAAQGLVLTEVSVAAECWPGAVQFKWTCCRDSGSVPEPWCEKGCDDAGHCWERCCDAAGQCWETGLPGEPVCRTACYDDGTCYEECCDPTTGQCWGTDPTVPPTDVCVQGGTRECLPGIDPKQAAYDDCAAQNLELRDLVPAGACADGSPMFVWTCCGASTTPTPTPWCDKRCDDTGACYETCCDADGQCWTNGPTEPQPIECRSECFDDGTCIETCCDASGLCWTNDPGQPPCDKVCDEAGNCWETCCDAATGQCPPTQPDPACQKACDSAGTCTETCCDASGQCWTTVYPGDPQPPTDPTACVAQVAGGDGTCTDLETLLAYASWTCAAGGQSLAEHDAWGECEGGFLGLKFLCCP